MVKEHAAYVPEGINTHEEKSEGKERR